MIHSISSADNADRACLSPRPIAAKKSFTTWTFSCVLIEVSPFSLHRLVSDLIGYVVDLLVRTWCRCFSRYRRAKPRSGVISDGREAAVDSQVHPIHEARIV